MWLLPLAPFVSRVLKSQRSLQVLLVTRSDSALCRIAALETIANLVSRLREEYLALLPEALPFLSELMEDSSPAVEARTQELIKQLEELSEESLQDYLKP
jgi:U3 small nucleolar RNA-associated protein 10